MRPPKPPPPEEREEKRRSFGRWVGGQILGRGGRRGQEKHVSSPPPSPPPWFVKDQFLAGKRGGEGGGGGIENLIFPKDNSRWYISNRSSPRHLLGWALPAESRSQSPIPQITRRYGGGKWGGAHEKGGSPSPLLQLPPPFLSGMNFLSRVIGPPSFSAGFSGFLPPIEE